MTTCENGSEPQDGQPTYFWLTSDDVMDWLTATNGSKLFPLVEGIQPQLLVTADFCALDYPEPPSVSDAEVVLALTNPLSYIFLQKKLIDGAKSYAWATRCQCKAALTPGCTQDGARTTARTTPVGGQVLLHDFNPGTQITGISASLTQVDYGGNLVWRIRVDWFDAADNVVSTSTTSVWNHNQLHTLTTPVSNPAIVRAKLWIDDLGGGANSVDVYGSWTWTYSCEGEPIIVDVPSPPSLPNTPDYPTPTACTTDDLCKQLAALKANQTAISSMVTLIQRQEVPFAYIPGPAFGPLTGNGEVAVSGILALSVTSSDHPYTSRVVGHPNDRYDNGYVNVGTADGWVQRVHLHHSPQLITNLPAYVTKIGYSLPPMVTATISTFVREA